MKKHRYQNYDNVDNHKSFSDMMRWYKERRSKEKDLSIQIPYAQHKQVRLLQENRTQFSLTWIGHSTFLIQMNGLNILTDPVWANRMGFQKRLTNPGLAIEQLPDIDVVVISHGHYDHLDFGSIKKLKGSPTYFVPKGLKSAFSRRGYKQVEEANWWEHFMLQDQTVKLSFVPAQHWTKRSLTDTNTSNWGGWIVEDLNTDQSVYFVGDTGYFRGFQDIAERFHLDIVLMPIGAYEPEWFMATSHINPEDAVKAYLELEGKTFIPMHYGAYRLADDTGPEALDRLYKEWKRLNLSKDSLNVLAIGESYWGNRADGLVIDKIYN
ncbi:MBL fold metallo-hydrolase [Halalkalibacter nanhaiisediminis]|uniref:L-ascorbate metabolism protein UlaG (Beta-lactamase superfamily) n=1 Tax=Halalkalibacter nanhaiisediminis TaxID=688079 RepID=A0A562QBG1_9BACI|nr:MBL fold metallo-hydrolase [Halalkalibacter nanhaiisediminis]TWI54078.1 L-ascorbate metabolism protein UlaG (beta-lactamase superfamily) [Halalkalibacter nanhaiisediminis]